MILEFDTSLEFAPGIGPARAALLRSELGLATVGDLLQHYPFRYVDKSKYHRIVDVVSDAAQVQIKGRITRSELIGPPKAKRLVAQLEDESGSIELVWFKGAKWIAPKLLSGRDYIVFGKPSFFKGKRSISHPEFEMATAASLKHTGGLQAVYSSTEKLGGKGMHSAGILKLVQRVLPEVAPDIKEFLPEAWMKQYSFPTRRQAFEVIHNPKEIESLEAARNRLKFEELLLAQLSLVKNKNQQTSELPGVVMEEVGELFNTFFSKHLPFDLTGAQKRVIKEIRADMRFGTHMNRLLQGDVGSGKTVVALLTALLAIDNGFQVCLMAPTEILAQQHFQTFTSMLAELPVHVDILTGSTKTARRRELHANLRNGMTHILIGTHALIEPGVQFANLGMAIIDEQHRFGVKQRAKLWSKAPLPPHILVMTATPIPRTLSMTLYGDLDISVIDELPPGRKEIRTVHRTDDHRLQVFKFMEDEIKKGRQIYVVYPLIEESEVMDYKDLMDGYESLSRRFPRPEFQIGIVHGRLKPEAKDYEMDHFAKGISHILVSTTVIEVGVNVPNASVMIIESAEKFGLSQLHQLRGRVGRGAEQSYCLLMSSQKLGDDARTRLETMVRTTDGFEIAEVDMQLRGPGDIMGTQQSGTMQFKLADITQDKQLLMAARIAAEQILTDDPSLEQELHQPLRSALEAALNARLDWGRIS